MESHYSLANVDMLYGWQGDPMHIHYLGATDEGVKAAFAYLGQWDYGEPGEESDDAPSGEDTWTSDDGMYIMTASLSYGYVGLSRVVTSS